MGPLCHFAVGGGRDFNLHIYSVTFGEVFIFNTRTYELEGKEVLFGEVHDCLVSK